MTKESHEELDRICTDICDKICHWPYVLKDQKEMDDKCASCRPLIDLANLVGNLEANSKLAN